MGDHMGNPDHVLVSHRMRPFVKIVPADRLLVFRTGLQVLTEQQLSVFHG